MFLNQIPSRRQWQNVHAFVFGFLILCPVIAGSQQKSAGEQKFSGQKDLTLENNQVKVSVKIENGELVSDKVETISAWSEKFGSPGIASIETDADFALDVMYTDWQAPEKANNADNPILLTKKDFDLDSTLRYSDSLVLF